MFKYIVKRLILMIITLVTITSICFVLIRMLPAAELAPGDIHTEVVLARRKAQGYDKPYIVQLFIFFRDVITKGDFGVSDKLYVGSEAVSIFIEKLPPTIILNFYSIAFSIPLGIFFGIVAALKKNKPTDHIISTATIISISIPSFVYAFLIQYVFSYKLGILPFLMKSGTDYFKPKMFISMLPPVFALSFGVIASFTRTARAELGDVLAKDYMLLARAKGMTRATATVKHGLRNCLTVLLPKVIGEVVGIFGGSFIIERIFGVAGIGSLYINSINGRDYPIFILLTIFYTAVGLITGIIVDICYSLVDPRIRIGERK